MENRKFVSKTRYILAFTIATLIFFIGFAITYFFAYLEYQKAITQQDYVSYELFEDKLKFSFLDENICDENTYKELADDLNFQVQIMGQIETKFGKDNPDVIFRKKFYTLIQAAHFEFIRDYNKECNKSVNIILFFYSNEKEQIDKSEKWGQILGVLYEKNQGNLMIYSFDENLKSDVIKGLKEKYIINNEPVIIVNGNTRIEKFDNIDDVEIYLDAST